MPTPPQHNSCLPTVVNTTHTYKQTRVREAAAESPNAETAAAGVDFSKEKAETAASGNLETALIANGVKPDVARDLATRFPERVAMQIDCLDDRAPKNRAATLVASIRDDWSPPPAYRKRKNGEHDAAKATQQESARVLAVRAQADERRAALETKTQTTQLEDAMNARLDAFYEDLDASTRAEIDAAAKERLGVIGRRAGAEGAIAAMRRLLLRERGLVAV